MDEEGRINWDVLIPDLEERWQTWDRTRWEKFLKELAQPVKPDDWIMVIQLVRLKNGRRMDGDAMEHYLKEFFEVPILDGATKKEI